MSDSTVDSPLLPQQESLSDELLLEMAFKARRQAYAPYSGFAVGAAVLAGSGRVYTGCNVENSSYGLTVCAERVAVFAAIAAGEREIRRVAVVAESPAPPRPCGACLQVVQEFAPRDSHGHLLLDPSQTMVFVLSNGREKTVFTLRDLLPQPFLLNP